ncbi:MAG: hypothetical protein ACP5D6_09030 [Kosmotogaceae bacterium]
MTPLETMIVAGVWVAGIFMLPISVDMLIKAIDKGKELLALFWFFLGVFCPFIASVFGILMISKGL